MLISWDCSSQSMKINLLGETYLEDQIRLDIDCINDVGSRQNLKTYLPTVYFTLVIIILNLAILVVVLNGL